MQTLKEKGQKAFDKASDILEKAEVPAILITAINPREDEFDSRILDSVLPELRFNLLYVYFYQMHRKSGKKTSELAREFYNYVRHFEKYHETEINVEDEHAEH